MATTRSEGSSTGARSVAASASRRTVMQFDPTNVDLTDFDLVRVIRGTVDIGGSVASRAAELAKDATYVTVGLGLLSYQRAQVRRREFERSRRR